MSHQEETSRKTQDTLEGQCISVVLGVQLEEVTGFREVWLSLLRLLTLPHDSG